MQRGPPIQVDLAGLEDLSAEYDICVRLILQDSQRLRQGRVFHLKLSDSNIELCRVFFRCHVEVEQRSDPLRRLAAFEGCLDPAALGENLLYFLVVSPRVENQQHIAEAPDFACQSAVVVPAFRGDGFFKEPHERRRNLAGWHWLDPWYIPKITDMVQ